MKEAIEQRVEVSVMFPVRRYGTHVMLFWWNMQTSKSKKTLFNVGMYKQITLVAIQDGH